MVTNPIQIIPPYEPGYFPIPQVQPFTFRDGVSYVERFERLVKYLNRVILPTVNENINTLGTEFETEINTLIQQVNDAIQLVIDSSVVLQDPVLAAIIADTGSASRAELDALYATVATVNAVIATVNANKADADGKITTLTATVTANKASAEASFTDVYSILNGRLSATSLDATYAKVADITAINGVLNGRLSNETLDARYVNVSEQLINVVDFGALGNDSAHDEVAIQAAIDYAGPRGLKIIVPSGTYRLYETLYFRYNGIRMECDANVIMSRYHGSSIVLNGNFGQTTQPFGDLHISGGTWDMRGQVNNTYGCVVSIGKADTFSLKRMTMLNNWKSHAIECEGSFNGVIEDIKFGGFVDIENDHYYCEMIQVGQLTAVGFPRFAIDDKSPTHDVVISRCRQIAPPAGSSYWPAGVGNHSAPVSGFQGPYRIVVQDCDFSNCSYKAIRPWGFQHTKILRNKLNAPEGIFFDGDTPGGDLGFEAIGNQISADTNGINIARARGVRLEGNTITGANVGIFVNDGCFNVDIINNVVNTTMDNIQVQNNSAGGDQSLVKIIGNSLINGRFNIQLYNNANGAVSRCVIANNIMAASTNAAIDLIADGNVVSGNLINSTSGDTAVLAPSGANSNIIVNNAYPTGKTMTNAASGTNTIANNMAYST